ncbi:MAG: aminotransferase class I/II-fold pyridoxal phosphate-dependent enzyme [Candidatus Margulisiibacteriota bacterium]
MEKAERLKKLPPYVFARLDELKEEQQKKGANLIDLGMGNPNIPPPQDVIDELINSLKNPETHRYPSFQDTLELRQAIGAWCKNQYALDIDPAREAQILIGSKEGLIHFAFAFINPGDITLVPQPAYPAHLNGTILAGGIPYALPATEKNNYMPDFDAVDPAVAKKAKLLILSYPTNPTAAFATREYFEQAVAFAKKYNLILLHDFAYAEIYFDKRPCSMLEIKGAKDVCIEFHTCSKTFGMAGWRIGFAIGNQFLVETLRQIKTNLDYGLFPSIRKASVKALSHTNGYMDNMRKTYRERRDIFVGGLNGLGWEIKPPLGTMYVWFKTPKNLNASKFSMLLLEKTGIVVAPGTAFGENGEGYVRAALVDTTERIAEAVERIKKAGIRFA